MRIELKTILNFLDELDIEYNFTGKEDVVITKYSSFKNLDSSSISWVKNQLNYQEEVLVGLNNVLLIIKSDVEINEESKKHSAFISCENPKEAFFSILNEFFPQEMYYNYISPTAIVEGDIINRNAHIGHNCYIGKDVVIGNNVVIKNNVSIEGKVEIGENTIIHSGVVIGSDGFGYFQNKDERNFKVPHYGGVIIGKDVEIGANTCIDRGTLDDTIIGNNVKIDNLCHIAHNCIIGDNNSIVALSMIGGSVRIDKNTYIAPGVIVKNQIYIGANSVVGMGAVVTKDVEDNKIVAGMPAKTIRDNLEEDVNECQN